MILGIFRRTHGDRVLLVAGELRLQAVSDRFGDLTYHGEEIRHLAVVDVRPEMSVGGCVNELHVHAHLLSGTLDAALQNVHDAKLLRDLAQVIRRTFVTRGRSARNYF